MTKDEQKAYQKAYYQAHKEQVKAAVKAWQEAHKEERKASAKAWKEANKEKYKAYQKAYQKAYKKSHRQEIYARLKSDVNSLGQTKHSIRKKSQRYLKKYGNQIPGYQIHHCCTYDDPTKFIYCSKEMHRTIHQYLRDNHIDADSDHYELIKHLLDDSAVKFNIE